MENQISFTVDHENFEGTIIYKLTEEDLKKNQDELRIEITELFLAKFTIIE